MSERAPNPTVAHILPFAAWIVLMHFLDVPQLHPSWQYALRSAAGLALLVYAKPWRWYPALHGYNLPLAFIVGIAVYLAWVLPESPLAPDWLRSPYERWCVRPLGELRNPIEATPFAPAACGWGFTVIRALGSGLLIPFIEEFFWRGFLQRWVTGGDFWRQDAGRIDGVRFFLVAVVFGLEHMEWAAGIAAGLGYGWLYLRTRDIWAVGVAHAATNLLLAYHVVHTGSWQFW